MDKDDFKSAVYNSFTDILRYSNISLTGDQLERLRQATNRMAHALEMQIFHQTVSICKKLQKATVVAFDSVDKDMGEVKDKLNNVVYLEDVKKLKEMYIADPSVDNVLSVYLSEKLKNFDKLDTILKLEEETGNEKV